MSSEAILKAVGELRADVQSVKGLTASHGEQKERLDKLVPMVDAIQKAMKNDIDRKTMRTGGDTSSAAGLLVAKGYRTPADLLDVPIFADDSSGTQTTQLSVENGVKAALDLHDDVFTVYQIMRWAKGSAVWDAEVAARGVGQVCAENMPKMWSKWKGFMVDFSTKATMDTGTSGEGSEWVPIGYSSQLQDQIRLRTPEVGMFQRFNQPTKTFQFPLLTTMPIAYLKTEGAAVTQSEPTTANRLWTSYAFATYSKWTDEIDEDSIVAILPIIRSSMIRSFGEGLSLAIVSGDSDGSSHFDSDYQVAGRTYYSGFNGIRWTIHDDGGSSNGKTVTGSGAVISAAMVGSAAKAMGKFALDPSRLACLVNVGSLFDLMADSSVLTVDKFGPAATILTGQLASVHGIPVLVSYAVNERMNSVSSDGTNNGTLDTFSTAVIANRDNWLLGERRDVRFERDKVISTGTNEMVVTARWSWNYIETNTGDAGPAAAIINID